jgi:ATP-dependent Lon protease
MDEKELECGICYLDDKLVKTDCNHVFCSKCLTQWREIKNNCPMCRNIISYTIQIKNRNIKIEKRVTRSMTKDKREKIFYEKFKVLASELSREHNETIRTRKLNELIKLSMKNYMLMPLMIYDVIMDLLEKDYYDIYDRNIIKTRLMELKPYINHVPQLEI